MSVDDLILTRYQKSGFIIGLLLLILNYFAGPMIDDLTIRHLDERTCILRWCT